MAEILLKRNQKQIKSWLIYCVVVNRFFKNLETETMAK